MKALFVCLGMTVTRTPARVVDCFLHIDDDQRWPRKGVAHAVTLFT